MNAVTPAQTILINGLRRSGTTILWQTFRNDPANLCFDEPFHPALWRGKRNNKKGTWTELSAARTAPPWTVPGLTAIAPLDELDPASSPQQQARLRELMLQGRRTVIDDVRIWNRLPDLLPSDIRVVVVFLLRDPMNWISAILRPRGNRPWTASARDAY